MKNISLRLFMLAGLLVGANSACANLGENRWEFAPNEEVFIDTTGGEDRRGFSASCEKFAPSQVSFTIAYQEPEGMKYKLSVKADDPSKVKHDEVNHIYTVTNATALDFEFYYPGKYKVINKTGTKVIGTECDAGLN